MIKSLLAGMMVAAVCAVQAGEYGDSAVRAARELSGAVKTGDMMWMIEKMYPPMKTVSYTHLTLPTNSRV